MAIILLLLFLATSNDDLVSVNDDNVVTRINVGRVFGLVLATQAQRDFASKAAEHLTGCINHIPFALNLSRLCREGLHLRFTYIQELDAAWRPRQKD